MLIPGQNALGQAAVTLTSLVNTQNAAGLDQNGNVGGALLAVGGPQVLTSETTRAPPASPPRVSDLGALTTSNYDLEYDGTNWSMTDTATGQSTPAGRQHQRRCHHADRRGPDA